MATSLQLSSLQEPGSVPASPTLGPIQCDIVLHHQGKAAQQDTIVSISSRTQTQVKGRQDRKEHVLYSPLLSKDLSSPFLPTLPEPQPASKGKCAFSLACI